MAILFSKNIVDALHKRIAENPGRIAWQRKEFDRWQGISWREIEDEVFFTAKVLESLGVKPGDRVALISANKPRWAFCDFAILSLGAVTIPIYPSLTSDDVYFILSDAKVKIAIVDDSVQLSKVVGSSVKLNWLEKVVSMSASSADPQCLSLAELIKEKKNSIESLSDTLEEWRNYATLFGRENLASIVYTSGTTGVPKGVPLTHGQFLAACEGVLSVMDISVDDSSLFFLPPAHVLGRIEQILNVLSGWKVSYCENLNHFAEQLLEVNPTFFVGVPRIFEKIFQAVASRFKTGIPFGKQLFQRALKVAQDYSKCLETKIRPSFFLQREYDFFNGILYSKVAQKFGNQLRFCVVGGAAMPEQVSRFFHVCGVLVLEGYGLTETAGPVSINTPSDFRFGTTGKLFFENRIRIGADGEILLKGPSVFGGYYSGKDSNDVFEADDFFHTGDVGTVDFDGYLRIIDRKKDLIVSSNGKNIAPQKLEIKLLEYPLISQALVVGGGDRPLGVLLSINLQEARKLFLNSAQTATRFDDWLDSSVFRKFLWDIIHEVNNQLAPYEKIKKMSRLPRDLSIDAGELTPSLKIKRNFCNRKFSNLIEDMYADNT